MTIKTIDLFAGPGGLGEGFSAFMDKNEHVFDVALSVEKDKSAFKTLVLRKFFRELTKNGNSDDYYRFLNGEMVIEQLYENHPAVHEKAKGKAWLKELGPDVHDDLITNISNRVDLKRPWALVGGPPCQAYSVIGRSRRGGISKDDHRAYLYREYLNVLCELGPPVFIMENVPGILSSSIDGESVFDRILEDLSVPCGALGRKKSSNLYAEYRIFSLSQPAISTMQNGSPRFEHKDYIIKSEAYGVPQSRHRVILFGVRKDLKISRIPVLKKHGSPFNVADAIYDLPKIRSRISKSGDSLRNWNSLFQPGSNEVWLGEVKQIHGQKLYNEIMVNMKNLKSVNLETGDDHCVPMKPVPNKKFPWKDNRLATVSNHRSRSHLQDDIRRYLFASSFTRLFNRNPVLKEYPDSLLPKHKSVMKNIFTDRFRVQAENKPSRTVTSHISKDGHYYIHPDPVQCRSLTVREAARLQTFPDNYYFCGPRTMQFHQVGNAVPPYLAYQIAGIVYEVLKKIDE